MMTIVFRPILELTIMIPGILLAYLPVRSYLKKMPTRLLSQILFLFLCLSVIGGTICYRQQTSTAPALIVLILAAVAVYIKTLHISLWKSCTIVLSICAVFSCINSLSRAVNAALILNRTDDMLWLCIWSGVIYNAVCWLFVACAYYPATHAVQNMIEDDNFAQTWYVFWILPVIFIVLNKFMVPQYRHTLYTGRVLQGYIVISLALLLLLIVFFTVFFLMAESLNRNSKLQLENHLLSMQQERYDNLKTSIEEARQARHDMRHHFNMISALAQEKDLEKIQSYLNTAISRIPDLDMNFCENRAADSVIGYYCSLAKREEIPFHAQIDLPAKISVDELDMCLILSNLLENAVEASQNTAPVRRQIKIQVYMHSRRLLLIQVENTFDGEIREKNGIFQSSKRSGNGIGIQSVRHIAEKSNGTSAFTYHTGLFSARVMLCGADSLPS